MKPCKLIAAFVLPLGLAGCLEVQQFPPWIKGEYAGKKDPLPFQKLFHNDILAWNAAIINRNGQQNEYNRIKP